jgi:hypothetical protein
MQQQFKSRDGNGKCYENIPMWYQLNFVPKAQQIVRPGMTMVLISPE